MKVTKNCKRKMERASRAMEETKNIILLLYLEGTKNIIQR